MWLAGLNTPINKVSGTCQFLGTAVAMPCFHFFLWTKLACLDRAPVRVGSGPTGLWTVGLGEYVYVLSPDVCCVRRKNLPTTLVGSSGWSKNYIDMRQINRRKSNKNLIPCEHGRYPGRLSNAPKLKPSRTLWGAWAWMPFCPPFLVGKTPASITFPEFQRADSNSC